MAESGNFGTVGNIDPDILDIVGNIPLWACSTVLGTVCYALMVDGSAVVGEQLIAVVGA